MPSARIARALISRSYVWSMCATVHDQAFTSCPVPATTSDAAWASCSMAACTSTGSFVVTLLQAMASTWWASSEDRGTSQSSCCLSSVRSTTPCSLAMQAVGRGLSCTCSFHSSCCSPSGLYTCSRTAASLSATASNACPTNLLASTSPPAAMLEVVLLPVPRRSVELRPSSLGSSVETRRSCTGVSAPAGAPCVSTERSAAPGSCPLRFRSTVAIAPDNVAPRSKLSAVFRRIVPPSCTSRKASRFATPIVPTLYASSSSSYLLCPQAAPRPALPPMRPPPAAAVAATECVS
mmetsp:Transcript_37127/g.82601  ORF Transcript_37127/g.82601 Transcript_37127/m.82601 type:complete len:293 (-) Transcript_37127:183-1061(-)